LHLSRIRWKNSATAGKEFSHCWKPKRWGSSHSDQLETFLSSGPLPNLTFSDPVSEYLCVRITFQKLFFLLFLNIYSLSKRNTQLDSWPRTFSSDLLPNLPRHFYSRRFLCPSPHLDFHITPDNAGNSLFNWISSSQLDTLNNRDTLLAPAHLAPTCEWRTLPGLVFDHLPIDITLPLAPIYCPTRASAFNFKKIHRDEF